MTADHVSQYLVLFSFACLALGSLGQAVRVLVFGRLIVALDWRGHLLKWLHGLGWLLFGLGCSIKTGLVPVSANIGHLLIGLGVIFLLFFVMLVFRAVNTVPGSTPGTNY